MTFREIKRDKLTVVISEGGVTVLGNGWDYSPPGMQPLEAVDQMDEVELNRIADAALESWSNFNNPIAKGISEMLDRE